MWGGKKRREPLTSRLIRSSSRPYWLEALQRKSPESDRSVLSIRSCARRMLELVSRIESWINLGLCSLITIEFFLHSTWMGWSPRIWHFRRVGSPSATTTDVIGAETLAGTTQPYNYNEHIVKVFHFTFFLSKKIIIRRICHKLLLIHNFSLHYNAEFKNYWSHFILDFPQKDFIAVKAASEFKIKYNFHSHKYCRLQIFPFCQIACVIYA